MASVPFEISLVYAGRSISFWIGLALVGATLLHLLASTRQLQIHLDLRTVTPPIVAVLYTWFTIIWSIDSGRTMAAAAGLTFTALSGLAAALALSGSFRRALGAFVFGTTVSSVLVIAAEENIDGRADTLANANDVAVLLAMAGASLTLWSVQRGVRFSHRILALAVLVLHLVALLATGSRSGVLALIAALTSLLIVSFVRLRIGILTAVLVLTAAIAIIVVYLDIPVPERISEIPQALSSGDLNAREIIWAAALPAIPSALGIGFGATPAFMESVLGIPAVMHSTYLGLALELGVVGLIMWTWMVFRLARQARTSPWASHLFMMGITIAIMATSLTLEARRPLWLFIALLASVSIERLAPKQKEGGAG